VCCHRGGRSPLGGVVVFSDDGERVARRERALPAVRGRDGVHGDDEVVGELGRLPELVLQICLAGEERELHPCGADLLDCFAELVVLVAERDGVIGIDLSVQVGNRADSRQCDLEVVLALDEQLDGIVDRHLAEHGLLDLRVGGEERGCSAEQSVAVVRQAGDVPLHHRCLGCIRERGRAVDSTHGWPP